VSQPEPVNPSIIDAALIDAAAVWGDPDDGPWDRFRPDRARSLRESWNARPGGDARDRLRRGHEAQVTPDLARVHVTWWTRALRAEPLSVRAALLPSLPAGDGPALRADLKVAPGEGEPSKPADPLALRVAQALWRERLVGDLPERPDDPPVVVALTRFDARATTRLIRTAGLAKWSVSSRPLGVEDPKTAGRSRDLAGLVGEPDPRLSELANRDVRPYETADAKALIALGQTTIARLLQTADPYRLRWVLQHLPYPVARQLRVLAGPAGQRSPTLATLEAVILRAAWIVLHREGVLDEPWHWEGSH
jgi:hypothetical protein